VHIAGIVAEYNPFHNGHLYHIEETKKKGATHIIAVMSGNFVQRAEPAVVGKFERARVAASLGVDLVIELPFMYSTAVSERFARGAVSVLEATGAVSTLSFGSESGDIHSLALAEDAVRDAKVRRRIKLLTEMGDSYPAAQAKALQVFYPGLAGLVAEPNNLLALGYIKALRDIGSSMSPVTVERRGAKHDGGEAAGAFASARMIRELVALRAGFGQLLPKESELMLLDAIAAGRISEGLQRIESTVLFCLRRMTRQEANLLPDASTGIGDRLFQAAQTASSVEELYRLVKTKRYTMSRVRRAVIAALLGVTEADYYSIPYLRLLAIGAGGEEILRVMKRRCKLPVAASLSEIEELGGVAKETAERESAVTDIYNLTLAKRAPKGEDYTTKLFKL